MKISNILLLFIILIPYLQGCSREEKTPAANRRIQEVPPKFTLHQGEYKAYITYLMQDSANIFIVIDTLEWIDDKANESGFSIRNVKQDSLCVKLHNKVKIIMQTYSRSTSGEFNINQIITAEQFISYLTKNSKKLRLVPFNINIVNDEVQSVNEIYIP